MRMSGQPLTYLRPIPEGPQAPRNTRSLLSFRFGEAKSGLVGQNANRGIDDAGSQVARYDLVVALVSEADHLKQGHSSCGIFSE